MESTIDTISWPKFSGYEKMTESSADWVVPKNSKDFKSSAKWVVLEKVHGSNLCFVSNGVDIKTAKRSDYLEEKDEFFG